MVLEDKFTKEGLPIVEEDFKNHFLFDFWSAGRIEEAKGIEYGTGQKFWDEMEKENPEYARSIYLFAKQKRGDFKSIALLNAIGYNLLKEQGKKHHHLISLPNVTHDTSLKESDGVFAKLIKGTALRQSFTFVYRSYIEEIQQENPVYASFLHDIGSRFSNIKDHILFSLSFHYKLLKEQAKKDGLGEKIRKMGKT